MERAPNVGIIDSLHGVIVVHDNGGGLILGKADAIALPFQKRLAVGSHLCGQRDTKPIHVLAREWTDPIQQMVVVTRAHNYRSATVRVGRCHIEGTKDCGADARRKLERADTSLPIARVTIRLTVVVLIGVPEGAIVDGVDTHRTVITPAAAWTT